MSGHLYDEVDFLNFYVQIFYPERDLLFAYPVIDIYAYFFGSSLMIESTQDKVGHKSGNLVIIPVNCHALYS